MLGCVKAAKTRGLCGAHYKKLLRYGDPLAGPGRGTPGVRRGAYDGGAWEYTTSNGYRKVKIVGEDGLVHWPLEHRHVMTQMLGRPLRPNENVHHIDGNKLNNDPENLELWVTLQRRGQRVKDLVAFAHTVLTLYG